MHAVATRVAEAEAAHAAAVAAAHARAQALLPPSSTTTSSAADGTIASTSSSTSTSPIPSIAKKVKRLSIFGGKGSSDDKPKSAATSLSEHTTEATASSSPPSPAPVSASVVVDPSTPEPSMPVVVQPPQPLSPVINPALVAELSPAKIRLLKFIGGDGISIIKHGKLSLSLSLSLFLSLSLSLSLCLSLSLSLTHTHTLSLSLSLYLSICFCGSHSMWLFCCLGRQGAPKHRVLTCDDEVTELIVQASDSHYKKCSLSEVEAIRLGTDVDPATPKEVLARVAAESQGLASPPSRTVSRRATSRMSILGGSSVENDGMLFGTAILRRTCKKDDMAMCISLILPDRYVTFLLVCMH
jgi:hypothetical protein